MSLYTKEQIKLIFGAWHVTEPLPTAKQVVYINFPGRPLNLGTVTLTKHKATYGGRLYKIDLQHVEPGQLPQPPKEHALCIALN
jgi:hypothetical protein